jgi:hypothetical protein
MAVKKVENLVVLMAELLADGTVEKKDDYEVDEKVEKMVHVKVYWKVALMAILLVVL